MQRQLGILSALTALALSTPAFAQSELEKGFSGALRGCEKWILDPASWARGSGPFVAAVGLGNTMGLVDHVEEVNLPPPQFRRANHYWRINSTLGAGYVLVVSDQLPMCHITGGGDTALQPLVEAVLASSDFAARWEKTGESGKGDMTSTKYRSREDAKLTMVVSRARQAHGRLDRVQVLATAVYNTSK
jgi:hypothetical protein